MSIGTFVRGTPYQPVNFIVAPDDPNLLLLDGGVLVINLAQLFNFSNGTLRNVLGPATVTTGKLDNGAVTSAKAAVFVSTEQTGTGSAQNIPHPLGAVPSVVLIVPTDTTTGAYTAVEGAHTDTNIVVTVTAGKKFKVFAWE